MEHNETDTDVLALDRALNLSLEEIDSEVSEEENSKQAFTQQLLSSKKNSIGIKQIGNITTNKFGADYQKKRQRKNKVAKQSRKRNK